jgi:microcystin-dependent protein
VFTVRLGEGDANNAPVGTEVFFKFDGTQRVRTDVKLKVWFSPTAEGPYTRLDPDITFASVPFAQVAGVAETVKDGAVDSSVLADGAVTLSKIEPGWGTVPPGTVIAYGIPGTALPDGYLECDGSAVAAATYPRLAALLGEGGSSAYGAVGAGQVKLPDLRGRVAMGQGKGDTWIPSPGNDQSTNWVLGQKFGAERHVLSLNEMPKHNHNVRDLGHDHPVAPDWFAPYSNSGSGYDDASSGGARRTGTGHANIAQDDRGDNQPHNNMQPSLVVRYLIKY